jgi:hypothetical protein
MHAVRRNKTKRQKCDAKGRRKGDQIQEFMFGDKRNVEYEMCDHTGNNWSHRNSNKRFKERCGSHTKKTFSSFTTKDIILGTSRIIRKVRQSGTLSLNGRDHRWFKGRIIREKSL